MEMPNRISVIDGDPGCYALLDWRAANPGSRVIVLLDGSEVKFAQTADVDAGFVTFTREDENGNPAIDWSDSKDPCWANETRYGEVKIAAGDRR